jgi:hypothetical protein
VILVVDLDVCVVFLSDGDRGHRASPSGSGDPPAPGTGPGRGGFACWLV